MVYADKAALSQHTIWLYCYINFMVLDNKFIYFLIYYLNMKIVRGVITEEIEKQFRKIAMEKFGYSKGALSKALEEAIKEWIKNNK